MGDYRGSVDGHRAEPDPRRLRASQSRNREDRCGAGTPPFATIPAMDLTLLWRALFHGQAVGEVVMHSPQLNLVQSQANEEKQLGTGVNWPQEIRDLFPFQLNLVEARDGLVTFRAPGISTDDSLTMRDFQMQLRNLTNVQDLEEPAFAELDVTRADHGQCAAHADRAASIRTSMTPTFDIDLIDRRRAARRREPVAARIPEGRRRDGRVLDVLGARGRRRSVRRLRAADPRGPAVRLRGRGRAKGRSAKRGKGS